MGNFRMKIKKVKSITEEDVPSTSPAEKAPVDNTKQIAQLIQQKNEIEKQMSDANVAHQQKKGQLENQILQIKKKLAELGDVETAKSDTVSESIEIITEGVGEATKRESLSLLIEQAYNNVEDISYTLDAKGRDRLSRKIIEFINFNAWTDNKNHWPEVKDCIMKYFKNGVVNYSTKELDELLNSIENTLRISDNEFIWIFGK